LPAAFSLAIIAAITAGTPFGGDAATRQDPPLAESPAIPGSGADVFEHRIVVKFKSGVPAQAASVLLAAHGGRTDEVHARSQLRTVEVNVGLDVGGVLARLRQSPLVAEANVS